MCRACPRPGRRSSSRGRDCPKSGAAAAFERTPELQRLRVALQHFVHVVLPELLDVAEQPELESPLQVGAERRAVGRLGALEVVGPVAGAAMEVGDDHGAELGELARLLRSVLERSIQALGDGAVVVVLGEFRGS
jgi:hypothetical protein